MPAQMPQAIHPWDRVVCALAVIVLAAGCGQTAAGDTGQAAGPAGDTGQAAGLQRCHTAALSATLGTRTVASPGPSTGQTAIPLVYTNTSKTSCQLHGVPGLDLHGPADPNGPVYQLRREDKGGGVTLAPGAGASARIVVLSYEPGSVGSGGSTRWTPTELVTIPPGETTPLTVAWPAGLSVLRQDEATHPGSWIESFTG